MSPWYLFAPREERRGLHTDLIALLHLSTTARESPGAAEGLQYDLGQDLSYGLDLVLLLGLHRGSEPMDGAVIVIVPHRGGHHTTSSSPGGAQL
jgi:hypothetical protein